MTLEENIKAILECNFSIAREEVIESAKTRIMEQISRQNPLEDELENQKTGHWKKISPSGIMECSICGGNVLTSDIECYKYCHHCGTKMKGDIE